MAHNEQVNHPAHYQREDGRECIDVMEEVFGTEAVIHFCQLNAFKYRWRKDLKGNPEQDLAKAKWYENKAKELVEKKVEDEKIMAEVFAEMEAYHKAMKWDLFRQLLNFKKARYADDANTELPKFIWIWIRTILCVLLGIERNFGWDSYATDLAYRTTGYSICCGEEYEVLRASTKWWEWGYEIYNDSAM